MEYNCNGVQNESGAKVQYMQNPKLHKGDMRVCSSVELFKGDTLVPDVSTKWETLEVDEAGESEFKGMRNYNCKVKGF